jgi:small subunit ribosomal protein S9
VTDVEQPDDEQRTPDAEAPAEEAAPTEAASDAPVAETEAPASEEPAAEQPAADEPTAAEPAAEEPVAEQAAAEEPTVEEPVSEQAAAEEPPAEEPVAEQPDAAQPAAPAETAAAPAPATQPAAEGEEELVDEAPRVKPEIPGADLVPDIVPEGGDALGHEASLYDEEHEPSAPVAERDEEADAQPIADAAISLATGARYTATGKRKTAVARVTLKPGSGDYIINGKALDAFFPRPTLQRNIRQPLETVGYEARMDVIAKLHGGGVSAQAGALRHGISRALLEADPNLRGELKRRGFLTRDARAKERKKAGLKKARKRPQFSKR